MRRTEEKKRQRLSLEHFMAIRRAAAPWLRTAMDLALQTTHARLEVSRLGIQFANRKMAFVVVSGSNSQRMVSMERFTSTAKRYKEGGLTCCDPYW